MLLGAPVGILFAKGEVAPNQYGPRDWLSRKPALYRSEQTPCSLPVARKGQQTSWIQNLPRLWVEVNPTVYPQAGKPNARRGSSADRYSAR